MAGCSELLSEALNNILSKDEYRNSIIWGWECIGFDTVLCDKYYSKLKEFNIKFIISAYDPHSFYIANGGDIRKNKKHDFIDYRVERANLIISTSHHYYININPSRYLYKSHFIPFSFNKNNEKLYKFNNEQWKKRIHKIFVIGNVFNITAYPERYKLGQKIKEPPLNEFCDILSYKSSNRFSLTNLINQNGLPIKEDKMHSDLW